MPRYSIRTILGLTGLVAVNMTAYLWPLTMWARVAFYLTLIVLVGVAAVAAGKTSSRAVFCRGLLAGVLLFVTQAKWEPGNVFIDKRLLNLPTFYYAPRMFVLQPDEPEIALANEGRDDVVMQNAQLVFGSFCGSLAVWWYRRSARRGRAVTELSEGSGN